ncbi:unnamed protein product [Gordionus sp. m RMFG-2023]|uniref:sodium- and chloride-dependent glycine transporter 2-like n=1 Tax=Gordionus sp. m RMFG-2023 TaxID=3053472 RepID=UPI0030E5592C
MSEISVTKKIYPGDFIKNPLENSFSNIGVNVKAIETLAPSNVELSRNKSSIAIHERDKWDGKLDFLMSCIGYAAGLGNVWRFPAMAGKNGGGAFLVPYFIMLLIVGIPLFYIEISQGQFASLGPIKIWRVVPLAEGIGYGMVFITSLVNMYYNVIVTWIIYYFFASMQAKLPWTDCEKPWNTPNCFSYKDYGNSVKCKTQNGTYYLHQCFKDNSTYYNTLVNKTKRISPSEEYFYKKMLQSPNSIEKFEGINWDILLTLLLSWLIVFLIMIHGIKSSGKVVYFTALFPYFVLIILVIKGATLEGAIDGIKFYIVPKWRRLLDLQVWTEAAGQMFFSLSCAMGGLHALSSYNKFDNNVLRDTWIVTLSNSFTSIFAGFAIFSVIGNMSMIKNIPVEDIAASGTGLAFIAYPEALLYLPLPPIWSLIFFFMLFLLGIDSQSAGVETVTTALFDSLNIHNIGKWKKSGITLIICVGFFILSIPLVSRTGIYWVELLNSSATDWGLILIALMEGVAISYIYGINNLIYDIEMMIGTKPKYTWLYWKIVWAIFPLIMATLFVLSWFNMVPLAINNYVYPKWADTFGVILAGIPVLFVPILFTKNYYALKDRTTRTFLENVRILSQPRDNWGPELAVNRTGKYKPLGILQN